MSLGTNTLVGMMIAAYAAAVITFILELAWKRKSLEGLSTIFLAIAFALNTWAIAGRWIEAAVRLSRPFMKP